MEVGVKINARRHNTFLAGRSLYFGAWCQEKIGGGGGIWRGEVKHGLGDNLENLSVLLLD